MTTERPLADIAGISPYNPRDDHAKAAIDQLAASIDACGLIEPLIVHADADKKDKLRVLSGGCRYKALRALVKADKLDPDWGCPVEIVEGTPAALRAIALAANVIRTPMHPVAEYTAFAALADADMDEESIARAFGIDGKRVKQRLALGRLAPAIRAAWHAGKLSEDCAKAFAGESHATQVDVYKGMQKDRAPITPYAIKHRLRADSIDPHADQALFVGEAAYRAAGGRIDESLFEDDVIWRDGALCRQLARTRLEARAAKIMADEGWGFYVIGWDGDAVRYSEADITPDYIGDEEKRLNMIGLEVNKLIRNATKGDAALREARDAAIRKLRDEAEEIEGRALCRAIPHATRVQMGIHLGIDEERVFVVRAIEKPRDVSSAPRAAHADRDYDAPPPPPRRDPREAAADDAAASTDDKPSSGVRAVLDAALNQAFASCVIDRPDIAMMLAVLAATGVFDRVFRIEITCGEAHRLDRDHALIQALYKHGARDATRLCVDAGLADLTSAFAALIAESVRVETHALPYIGDFAVALIGRGADLRGQLLKAFDYAGYFAAATKAAALAAIDAIDGPAAAAAAGKLKKEALAARAATLAQAKGWLPAPLGAWVALQPQLPDVEAAPRQEAAE